MNTITRNLQKRIVKSLKPNHVVLIFGARRVGKTILMSQIGEQFKGKKMIMNGEDYDTLALLENRSISNYRNLLNGVDLLIIDEAQHIPDIGAKLKLMVDEIKGVRIMVSGSSSFDLFNKSGEPLVGRGTPFLLTPFSQSEISQWENRLQTQQNMETRLVYGSYPDVVLMDSNEQRKEYLKNIVNAYLLKDILMVDGLKNASKMSELLQLIALQIGSEVSYEELGKQLGMSKNTVEKYLDLLSKTFVIFRLGAFSRNPRKEITKAGKWYFYDTGVRNALIGAFNSLPMRQDIGKLWENYIISERMKKNLNENSDKNLYFWRTYSKQEIDLIETDGDKISAFEIKWGDKQPKTPSSFSESYPQATFEVVNRGNYLGSFFNS
ncbi:MAG: ATP-binding protein [Bacteroidales bacterium]|jgi:predicted AAA+ superfamily ATPase|nr:ATP-binding protein [Bacteroidales bacterium]